LSRKLWQKDSSKFANADDVFIIAVFVKVDVNIYSTVFVGVEDAVNVNVDIYSIVEVHSIFDVDGQC
jgi:hypothetical protein